MLNRAFFSLQSNWIPTAIALGNLGLNAILDAAFYKLGIWGIPLSTSLVNIAGTWALIELLRRRLGRLELAGAAVAYVKIALASGLAAGVGWAVWWALDHELGRSVGAQIFSLIVALVAATDAYLVGCLVLRIRELGALLSLRARIKRAAGHPGVDRREE